MCELAWSLPVALLRVKPWGRLWNTRAIGPLSVILVMLVMVKVRTNDPCGPRLTLARRTFRGDRAAAGIGPGESRL